MCLQICEFMNGSDNIEFQLRFVEFGRKICIR